MRLAYLVDSIGWTLLHFAWQGLVIASLTALALGVLRNASPTARYNAACAGLLACVLWPGVELVLRLQGHDMVSPHMRLTDALVSGAAGNSGGLAAFLQAQMLTIVAAWAVCASLLALRIGMGMLWIARTRHLAGDPALQAVAARLAKALGVARTVTIRVASNLASPQTAGWWRPVILVPASLLTGMPPQLLEALLAHEMAHIKRFDYAVNLAQNLIEVVFFYQPAVWWMSGRIRAERELIADDLAARCTGEPRTLALALSELERLQFPPIGQVTLAATGGDLLERIQGLVRPRARDRSWGAVLPAVGMAMASVALYAHAGARLQGDTAVLDRRASIIFNSCAKPEYPASDLALGHTGTVVLRYKINEAGKVAAAMVHKSSGHAGLDTSASEAIGKCDFTPAVRDGRPVTAWTSISYVWTSGKR